VRLAKKSDSRYSISSLPFIILRRSLLTIFSSKVVFIYNILALIMIR